MALRVQHCKSAMEFFINFSNGSRARLQYRELPGRILDFDHTETPPDQQGKGVAKILVQEGFKYAAENNYKIIPTCWYVAKYANEMATADEKKLVCQ
nr:protein GTLF3B, putative [Haemonchus contortus]